MLEISIVEPYLNREIGDVKSPHSHRSALAQGLNKLGVEVRFIPPDTKPKTRHVACWGWRKGKTLRGWNHEVLVMERGYIGERFQYTSLGWNGLNGHALFPFYPDDNGKRFYSHGGKILPWKSDGTYALILGQVPGDASLKGANMLPWYEHMAREITRLHGLTVFFRPHPEAVRRGYRQKPKNTTIMVGELGEALSEAKFTVCYNSNSSVDSVLAGVPCIVGDAGSMAYPVCGKDLHNIIRPDREAWANQLAWRQWDIEEIRSGEALKSIVKAMA